MLTRETVSAYKATALELARRFRDDALDAIVYGCTAAGLISGPEGDAELAGRLEALTGRPVVTTARAMVDALEDSDAREVAVVTPYADDVNRHLTAFLADAGIHVRRLASFHAASVEELGRIGAEQVAGLARETMGADCDALLVACSQLSTHAIAGALAREIGRPVWSSIQASAWQTKEKLSESTARSCRTGVRVR